MVHLTIPPSNGGPDKWGKLLTRLIMVGFLCMEIAATSWIIYKIISPKY
jgi:hypothetical protein